jgi:hypothetical protein
LSLPRIIPVRKSPPETHGAFAADGCVMMLPSIEEWVKPAPVAVAAIPWPLPAVIAAPVPIQALPAEE